MTSEHELREKIRKISALFEGATTLGERDAAAAVIGRVQRALGAAVPVEPSVEMHFKLPDHWHRRLFIPFVAATVWNLIATGGSAARRSW